MLAIERQRVIQNLVQESGSVTISELTSMFGVSSETIRKDLLTLEKAGVLNRTHGGAVSAVRVGVLAPLQERKVDHLPEKRELCEYAIRCIQDGDVIAIGEGSTAMELAKLIACTFTKLTVATNGLDVFEILEKNPGLELILCGGKLDREERAFFGRATISAIEQFCFDKCFICPSGISLKYGIMDYRAEQIDVMDAYLRRSVENYVLAYSDRFEKPARMKLRDVDPGLTYITDSKLPPEIAACYEKHNIKIIKE